MKTILLYIHIVALLILAGCSKENAAKDSGGGGKAGSMARFAVNGNYLYVVNDKSIITFDVTNTNAPLQKNQQQLAIVGDEIETIFAMGDRLYIGSNTAMYIFSLTDPAKPVMESSVGHFRSCDPVVAKDNSAYVTLRTGGPCGGNQSLLVVYDVTNIKIPQMKKSIPMSAPYGLGYEGDALYVCDGANGLVVFDISSPLNPQQLSRISAPGDIYHDVIPYNGILIAQLADGVSFYDISQPKQPKFISNLKKS